MVSAYGPSVTMTSPSCARTVVAALELEAAAADQHARLLISSLSSPQRPISASNSGVPSCVVLAGGR